MLLAMYIAALTFISALSTSTDTTIAVPRLETVLSNRVIIYGLSSSLDVAKLAKVVNKFLTIWNNTRTFVNIPQDK
jgi:hypothetical protein